jgi:hypothetical protein
MSKPIPLCLIALASAACVTLPQAGPSPEQAAAPLREVQAQTSTFGAGLAAAVRAQPRDEAWAAAKERELRQSYSTHASVPRDALKGIECRQSRCELQVAITSEPEAPAHQQALAIDQWIAWSQPCGYSFVQEPGTPQAPGTVRIFLDCGR